MKIGLGYGFDSTPPAFELQRVGLRNASVFPGFCKKHDSDLFKEIESNLPISNKRQAALLGYRVTCMEYFKKEKIIRDFSGPDFVAIARQNGHLAEIEAYLEGSKLGLKDVSRTKREYEQAIHSDDFVNFHAFCAEMSGPLPFCFSSPFAPEFLFDGAHILPDIKDEWGSVSAFAGSIGGRSIFLICGFAHPQHDIVGYIKSAAAIPMTYIGGAALHTALEYAENTFFRQTWVDSLDAVTKERMFGSFASGTPGEIFSLKSIILKLDDYVNVGGSSIAFF